MKRSVLIVEDELPLSKALRFKLEREGFAVTTVTDGAAALRVIDLETFDLVLLDLVIPVADGFEVLRQLKEKVKKLPIIVLSNRSQKGDQEKVIELGAEKFFTKSEISLNDIVGEVTARLS